MFTVYWIEVSPSDQQARANMGFAQLAWSTERKLFEDLCRGFMLDGWRPSRWWRGDPRLFPLQQRWLSTSEQLEPQTTHQAIDQLTASVFKIRSLIWEGCADDGARLCPVVWTSPRVSADGKMSERARPTERD